MAAFPSSPQNRRRRIERRSISRLPKRTRQTSSDPRLARELAINGIDGATGDYLLPALTPRQLVALAGARARHQDDSLNALIAHLGWWVRLFVRRGPIRGLKAGLDPKKLEEAGWGVIFAQDADPAIEEALSPLLALRRAQATRKRKRYYQVYRGKKGYLPGQSKLEFIAGHRVGPGPADPEKMPYYLLLVGDPETIPFPFQYQLDVQYAVGRLHFDTVEEYACYAASVVEAEKSLVKPEALPRRATFFGVKNPDDRATRLCTDRLVEPLAAGLVRDRPDWTVDTVLADEATKARLGELLAGDERPTLLFTAGHGMGFRNGHSRQLAHQGALLCQDWPGPKAWRKGIPRDFYFAAEDLAGDTRLGGMIVFQFACFAGGTPRRDNFTRGSGERKVLAPHPFVAPLPQRLLSQGALAVVAHVDRAWGYSFLWPQAGEQLAVFESTFTQLMDGHPIGSAMEYFNQRYAELSTLLSEEFAHQGFGKKVDEVEISRLWTANNDARNYVVLGDPAVRIGVG